MHFTMYLSAIAPKPSHNKADPHLDDVNESTSHVHEGADAGRTSDQVTRGPAPLQRLRVLQRLQGSLAPVFYPVLQSWARPACSHISSRGYVFPFEIEEP